MPHAELDDAWTEFNANNPTGVTRDQFDILAMQMVCAKGRSRRSFALSTMQAAYSGSWPTLLPLLNARPAWGKGMA